MTDTTPGYLLRALDIRNPAGTVIRHKIEELGLVRKNLAQDCGTSVNYISMITSPEGTGPSFATSTGPRIVEKVLDAELAHPLYLRPAERKNFARRRKLVMEAMTLMSLYHHAPRQAEEAHALFARFAAMVPGNVYRAALSLVGEAVLGPIVSMRAEVPLSAHRSARTGALRGRRYVTRRDLADMLYDIETDPQCEELFEARGRALVADGDREAALKGMLEGYEGLVEERQGAAA